MIINFFFIEVFFQEQIRRVAGEGGGYLLNYSLPLLSAPETLKH